MANIDRVEARYYRRTEDAFVCELCQQKCFIRPGEFGYCGTRRADDDILVSNSYGKISSLSVDPIERMNLYHYKPHSKCLSVGSVGCNMNCQYCKNYSFTKLTIGKKRATYKSPEELLEMCREEEMDIVCFTYNEPMVWFEYIMDFARIAPDDMDIVLMTNGLVNDGPLKELCSIADAFSIDIKAFNKGTHKKLCDAELKEILTTARNIYDRGIHMELNYLVIPGVNDSDEEITKFCRWVKEISADVPVHFSRFQPDYQMRDTPLTPVEELLHCREIGMGAGLNYVYVGNTLVDDADDTKCPECGEIAVRRLGYSANPSGLDGSRCMKCGRDLNMVR